MSHPIHAEVKRRSSPSDRAALWITDKIGSLSFASLLIGMVVFWTVWNATGFLGITFDDPPGFERLTLVCAVIQLLTFPIILISQNVRGRRSDTQIELDYAQNVRMEKRIEELEEMIGRLEEKAGTKPLG